MTLHWWFLMPSTICSALSVALFYVRQAEQRNGRALLGWNFLSWNAERYPTLFKMRIASYWLFIGFFGIAALAFFAQFLGIVN